MPAGSIAGAATAFYPDYLGTPIPLSAGLPHCPSSTIRPPAGGLSASERTGMAWEGFRWVMGNKKPFK